LSVSIAIFKSLVERGDGGFGRLSISLVQQNTEKLIGIRLQHGKMYGNGTSRIST
jgi:hypothetical protein